MSEIKHFPASASECSKLLLYEYYKKIQVLRYQHYIANNFANMYSQKRFSQASLLKINKYCQKKNYNDLF
jgi:hypothetical protein